MNMYKTASKVIYAKISASPAMLETFNSAYDNLQPLISKFPSAFIPTFTGLAAQNDDFCDRLIS